MAVIALDKVSKSFGTPRQPVLAVDRATLTVEAGELVAIYGASGSGKTTLLMLAAGLERPDSGSVSFKDESLAGMSAAELSRLRRRELGFVFQSFNLVPALTALRNVALPLLLDGIGKQTATERAWALLAQVGLEDREMRKPHELSGGEQQRVAIARALVAKPALVLADEPTGNLDSVRGEEILRLLGDLCRKEGVATLLATHDARAATYADRILSIRDGAISSPGSGDTAAEAGVIVEFPRPSQETV